MKIKEILPKECVAADLHATMKGEILSELAGLLTRTLPELDREAIAKILTERECLGSTGIGNGVAIPHGKFPALPHIVAGFGRSVPGVNFDCQDGKPAHLFFVLLAPENAASMHLKALARLSRLLKDASFRNKLLEARTEEEIYQQIVSEDEKF